MTDLRPLETRAVCKHLLITPKNVINRTLTVIMVYYCFPLSVCLPTNQVHTNEMKVISCYALAFLSMSLAVPLLDIYTASLSTL